jgi:hypothetical protein
MAAGFPEITEAEATADVKALYEDIQSTLRVSLVPWPFRVLAANPKYFRAVWDALKPTITKQFELAADAIRSHAASQTLQTLVGRDHRAKLRAAGYGGGRVQQVQEHVLVFHYANPKLLLIVAVLKEVLEGRPVPVKSVVVTPTGRGIPPGMPKVKRIDQPTGKIAEIFSRIEKTFDLPKVSDEFRALAQWPEYLELAWGELQTIVQSDSYARVIEEIKRIAQQKTQEFPRRVDLGREELRAMGFSDTELREIQSLIDTLYRAYPRLVVSVVFLTLALAGPEETMLSGEALLRRWSIPQR